MDFEDLYRRKKAKRILYFTPESPCLRPLRELLEKEERKTIVLWALACARQTLEVLEARLPGEKRPRLCLDACEKWSMGLIKMDVARRAILDVHRLCRETENPIDQSFCRALAHGGSTVHTPKHAMGLPIYELTALVLMGPEDQMEERLAKRIHGYERNLIYFRTIPDDPERPWAPFLR